MRQTKNSQSAADPVQEGIRHVHHVFDLLEQGVGDTSELRSLVRAAEERLRPLADCQETGEQVAAHSLATLYMRLGENYISALNNDNGLHSDTKAMRYLEKAKKYSMETILWTHSGSKDVRIDAVFGLSRINLLMEYVDGIDRGVYVADLIEKAAEQGHLGACVAMAHHHLQGDILPLSDRKAKYWLDQAESKKEEWSEANALDIAALKERYHEVHSYGQAMAKPRRILQPYMSRFTNRRILGLH
jgi:TPR repeat protein